MNEFKDHNHDGINSQKLKTYNVIPTFTMTSTELTRYLSRPAIEGEEFNVYDGTNYRKYIRINQLWKYVSLS
jgi:UDP-glucose 4-epimerase